MCSHDNHREDDMSKRGRLTLRELATAFDAEIQSQKQSHTSVNWYPYRSMQNIDHLLPILPVAIVTAVLVFGGFWGFWGVLFAIPLATLVQAVIRAWMIRSRELENKL